MRGNCTCRKCKEKLKLKEEKEEKETQLINSLPLSVIYYSNFYSNQENQIILSGGAVEFKNNGPTNCFIFRLNNSQFNLTLIGVYEIIISVYIYTSLQKLSRKCYLIVKCDDEELPETKMINNGNYINGHFFICSKNINTIISIINSGVDSIYLNNDIYSHLIIKKIN